MKKRILIIIALIMIISTFIRTLIVGYSFFDFSKQIIQNESELIADIIMETTDKTKILNLIKYSKAIDDIEFIPNYKNEIKFDIKNKTIISYVSIDNTKSIKIIYKGNIYFNKLANEIIQLLIIALVSLIVIILIVNYFLTPYLEILESVKKSTQHILKGDFNYKIHTKLKGKAYDFVNTYNEFINKLNDSFGVIEEKYTSLIEKPKSKNPLIDAKETISQLADIFKFKNVIEEDATEAIILERIVTVIKKFNIKHYALIGIDNNEKKVFYTNKEGEICCNVEENPTVCRAYRTKHIVDSKDFENLCPNHICSNEYYCIPFSVEGNFTGILKIMYDKDEKQILESLPYIKSYLNEASSIIESKYTLKLLKKQSIKDPLTNLYNRRYMEETLPLIIANAKRKKNKVGFLMIDIDYFKKINDTYGHDAGDNILKTVSTILLNSIRESDLAVRFGGEEFLVILTNLKSKEDLLKTAEKIREAVEKTKFNAGKNIINKTVSIGGALYPDDCEKPWECIKFADLALYKAKNTGRNKVVIFDEKLKIESNY